MVGLRGYFALLGFFMQTITALFQWGLAFLGFLAVARHQTRMPLVSIAISASSELILRRIAKLVPEALVRAWADDIAMVARGGMHRLGHIQRIFS